MGEGIVHVLVAVGQLMPLLASAFLMLSLHPGRTSNLSFLLLSCQVLDLTSQMHPPCAASSLHHLSPVSGGDGLVEPVI